MNEFTIDDGSKGSLNIGQQTIKQSVMIATPMFAGQCTGHFTIATINAINEMKARGTEMFLANIMNESLIIRARNELVRMFLDKTSCSHIMFIDSDIYYESTAIPRLLDHDVDIVGGAYPKKEINWDRINLASTLKDKETKLEKYAGSYVLNTDTADIKLNDKGLLKVRHAGTGFMMIKREVFKRLSGSTKEYRASTIKDAENNYVKPITKMFLTLALTIQEHCYRKIIIFAKHGMLWEGKYL